MLSLHTKCDKVLLTLSEGQLVFGIKIIPGNRASYADCHELLRFEIFTSTIIKTPKNPFLEPSNVKPMKNRGLL